MCVFVASRWWRPAPASWVDVTTDFGNGWKEIRVVEAEDLATWLSACPGVHDAGGCCRIWPSAIGVFGRRDPRVTTLGR